MPPAAIGMPSLCARFSPSDPDRSRQGSDFQDIGDIGQTHDELLCSQGKRVEDMTDDRQRGLDLKAHTEAA